MNYEYDKVYILIYFVYGLAFFTMGISVLQNKVEKGSTFLLLDSIKFLGYFGLSHGVMEWILMIIIADIYNEYRDALFIMASFLSSLSFAFLYYYGIILIEYKGKLKKAIRYIPLILITIWTIGFLFSLLYLSFSVELFLIFNLLSRYLIGLPASIITAIALYRSIRMIKLLKLEKIAKRMKGLAISFFTYGILAGVFIGKTNYFPSNIINAELFYNVTGIHVELGRAVTAVIITILSVTMIDLFRWVAQQKIIRLTNLEIMNDERRRLCQNLHDVIIQNLFATGLRVESIMEEDDNDYLRKDLSEVKENLNETIYQIREYIGKISIKKIDIEGLKIKITDLIEEQKKSSGMEIEFYHDIADVAYNYSPSEKLVEIYFIVQEAIRNAIKHSNAPCIVVTLSIDFNLINAIVFDNGMGFDLDDNKNREGYGITSMNERALTIGGGLTIRSNMNGTELSLIVPWRNEYEQ